MSEENFEEFDLEKYLKLKGKEIRLNGKWGHIRFDKNLEQNLAKLDVIGPLTYLNKFKKFVSNQKEQTVKSKFSEDVLLFIQNLRVYFEGKKFNVYLLDSLNDHEFFHYMEQVLKKMGEMFPSLKFKYRQNLGQNSHCIIIKNGKSFFGPTEGYCGYVHMIMSKSYREALKDMDEP
jgi:hypothetical protein